VVYVKIPDREVPSFLYREIELGPDAGNYYIVADGLEEGEVVATNGVFKIDAAAQLEGKRSMMNPEGGSSGTGHVHGSMSTDAEDEPAAGLSAPAEFRKQLTAFYQAYIKMKDAFVETNAGKVQEEAGPVSKALNSIEMEILDDPEHTYWMEQQQVLSRTLNTILGSGDIEAQRKAFIDFNLAFYKTIKAFGLEGVETYYQYCPMANDDRGAYWFSNEEEIRNPYFGDVMLACGENREIIK
jgi:Cu(I)/Ag(I) efflux system membrane fusion protein